MTFAKIDEELLINYKKHNLDDPRLKNQRAVFNQTFRTIDNLSCNLDNFSRAVGSSPNHQLKIELGKLSYDYIKNSNSAFLCRVLYKVEFLHLVLDSIKEASILVADLDGWVLNKPRMVCGIDTSLLHKYKETSCCGLYNFFYVSAEEQLCDDVLHAVKRFNRALGFHDIGCEPSISPR